MPKQTIEAMVEGGKASAGPPLGPALGPAGVNVADVVAKINEKTKDMAGMKVPVKVIVNEDKSFDIEVGTPPVSALILKELGLQKGSGEPGRKRAGDLTMEQARKIARIKFGSDSEANVRQVIGSARSMGISFEKGEVTEEELKSHEEEKKEPEEAKEEPETREQSNDNKETTSG